VRKYPRSKKQPVSGSKSQKEGKAKKKMENEETFVLTQVPAKYCRP